MKTSTKPQAQMLNVKRLTVYLDAALDKQVRELAQQEDRPLSTIAERAFRAYVSMSSLKHAQ